MSREAAASSVRCLYEVLGIERRATSDEVRAAYKKLAMQFHPDKNHGNVEEAAVKFKEVQGAYQTLMDPEERSWYDSHRESILRGDSEGTCAPDEVNVFDYMTMRCFKGFTDGEGGFFAVYGKLFATLREEESAYDAKARAWPSFGTADTPFDKGVSEFYRFWRNFSSYKTFTWMDEVRLSDIADRNTRRFCDREQTKERAAAKRDYTAAVVHVANIVYKRDPRVKVELDRQAAEAATKQAEREKRELEAMKRRREEKEKIWAEGAAKEAQEEAEREARGEAADDGTTLELLYERQRQLERLRKSGKTVELAPGQGDLFANIKEDGDDATAAAEAAPAPKLKCDVCKKSFATNAQWQEHINSAKHKAKAKQAAAKGDGGDAPAVSIVAAPAGKSAATAAASKKAPQHTDPSDAPAQGTSDVDDGEAIAEPTAVAAPANAAEVREEDEADVPKQAKTVSSAGPSSSTAAAGATKDAKPQPPLPPSALKKKGQKQPPPPPPAKKGAAGAKQAEASSDDDDDEESSEDDRPAPAKSSFGAFASLNKKKR